MSKVAINEITLTNIGDAIREKTGKTDLIAPGDMPAEIASISTGGGGIEVEPIVLSGNCVRYCSGPVSSNYIKLFGNTITTNEISNANEMFKNSTIDNIPFVLNLQDNTTCSGLCESASITKAPVITGKISDWSDMFHRCYKLQDINEVANYSFTAPSSMEEIFFSCQRLRNIPREVNSAIGCYKVTAYYYYSRTNTYRFVSDCYSLEECIGVVPPIVPKDILNSNSRLFDYMVDSTYRLSKFTFATNEDGTPLIRDNYKYQTIDFSGPVGYADSLADLRMINLGFSANKRVTSLETYEALKNDPDWWTTDPNFSRYNHDSAVETINSLPDVSSSSATNNVIKFNGISGDGYSKAINTLTEEEIAVATAKGWTVTLV